MMRTVLRKHNQQYHHKSRFTRYLQYFRDVLLSYIVATPTSGLCVLNFALARKAEKTRNSLGEPFSSVFTVLFFATALLLGIYSTFAHNPEAFFGDDHDTVSRTPRTISPHPSAHTTQYFKRKPSYAEVGALGVLASSFHVQLASLFLMFIKCCASGFRSVKTFLAALAICTVFTTFSYYPTTCG